MASVIIAMLLQTSLEKIGIESSSRMLEFDLHGTKSTLSTLIGGTPIFLGSRPLLPAPIRSTGTNIHQPS
jgi:hypothetical protein